MTKSIDTYIIDSFTDEPFKGNPAGVCMLKSELQEDKMLSIAQELGLSETAFLIKLKEPGIYAIRFFSPKMEVPLCGHATLASAKAIFESNPNMISIHFVTVQNIDLHIKRDGDEIVMEFPVYDTIPASVPPKLLEALGIKELVNGEYNKETNILLVEIEDSKTLNELAPNFEKLKRSHNSINGVLVTSPSSKNEYDFESRYFWPWSGTNEDPVTGATHTFLTKYWSKRLNKKKMNSFQCSERTGFMEVELSGNNKLIITSTAQIVFKGVFNI